MVPIVTLLLVMTLSVLVTRIATIAFIHTGLSQESARFQARSAFTGVGFTTSESEQIVNHPVRRRILLFLMLVGNAGIIAVVASLILTFLPQTEAKVLGARLGFLTIGILLLWLAVHSKWIDRYLYKIVSLALKKYTDLDVKDYASLLRLSGDYRVTELRVEPDDWIADQSLIELKLSAEGVLVLGISRRDKGYIGSPKGETVVLPEDVLLLYGRISSLAALDERRTGARGDREHKAAVKEQERVKDSEE